MITRFRATLLINKFYQKVQDMWSLRRKITELSKSFSCGMIMIISSLLCLAVHPVKAESLVPTHEIHISFDIAAATLSGTSRISLPAGIPLTLQGGPLNLTGVVLNLPGAEAIIIKPDDDNAVVLSAGETPQTLLVSWQMKAAGSRQTDNLINQQGITLAGFWHPLPDKDMIYSVTADLPTHFTGITEAEHLTETMTANGKQLVGTFSHPLRAVHFAAGPYTIRSRKVSGSITLYSYFFSEDDQLAAEYLDKAVCYIDRYEKLIGPYPYSRFSIVENRLPTGYGMPGYTLLGQAVVNLPFIKDTSLGHEVLHSWFGNSIFLKDDEGNWCEGLTTYLADQSYAADKGTGVAYRKNQLLRYTGYIHGDNDFKLSDFSNAGHNQPMAGQLRTIGYDKGSMLFHMLRREVGDELFFQGLQRFYETMKYKRAGWSDIEHSFSAVTNLDLSGFFKQWLSRKDIPTLSVGKIHQQQEENGFNLEIQLRQNTEPYQLTIPIKVETVTDTIIHKIQVHEKENTVTIPVTSVPLSLNIDPEYDLMRTLTEEETMATWSRFMGARGKKVVVGEKVAEIYAPLLAMLKQQGCEEVSATDLANQDLQKGSYIFLGESSRSRTLFARPTVRPSGVTVDIRKNPLAADQVIVLLTSSSNGQSAKVARKLIHYGKYSYLHFEDGRLQEKRITQATNGIKVILSEEPTGVAVRQTQSFVDIINELQKKRVVYVGETHTDYGNHLLQLQIIQALHRLNPKLAIGMEMFPRHVQPVLDDYIQGKIVDEKDFLKKSAYFSGWGYDYRFYRPIINYARQNNIPLVALNLKKEIVSDIFRKGHTDDLTADQVEQIPADRDLDLPGYRQRLSEIHAMHGGSMGGPHGQKFSGFIQAQALWDETMAESVATFLENNADTKMVVLAGTGHVYKDSGIPPRVARRLSVTQAVVAGMYSGEQGWEVGKKLDYLLFTESASLPPTPKIGVMLKEEIMTGEKGDNEKNLKKIQKTFMRISGISPHGKAGESGLREEDIILRVEGRIVETINDVKIALFDKKPGDFVQVKIKRERTLLPDEELTISVELSSMQRKPPGHP